MKKLKPICDSCPSGEYFAKFDSINDKQRIHHKGRMSNFYNFLIVDDNDKPIWNPDKQDYYYAGVQANTPTAGRYRHAKIHVLPRILTPSQFTNYQDDKYGSYVYDFPTMEMLLEIARENKLTWKVKVEYKDLATSSFSKITHIVNPRTSQWEATDCQSRGKKAITNIALNTETKIYTRDNEPEHLAELRRQFNERRKQDAEELQGDIYGNTNIN